MKGNSEEGMNFLMECLVLNLYMKMECSNSRQIEAARIATRFMKREGQLWIKIFPDKPITKKPLEVRMGKGKGAVEYWLPLLNPEELCLKLEEFLCQLQKRYVRLKSFQLKLSS
jgi:large subunit ribosomal protein L16